MTDETVTIDATTYDYTYGYDTYQPHAVTSAGPKSFSYDLNGNMTTMVDSEKGLTRSVTWNNENRITRTQDRYAAKTVTTDYGYDAAGTRVRKSGIYGTTLYVNNGYTVKDGELEGVHIFAGNTRLVSKMILHERKDGTDVESEAGTWYYHADHLGSSSVVTDRDGDFYEQIEYFPYGETWVHNKSSEEMTGVPYKYSSKLYDTETGWYYYGVRYYDPRLSKWISVDPAFKKYIPDVSFTNDRTTSTTDLPGHGGVYRQLNLEVYHFSGANPLKYVDPDGNEDVLIVQTRARTTDQRYESTAFVFPDGTFNKYNLDVVTSLVKMKGVEQPSKEQVESFVSTMIGENYRRFDNFSSQPDKPKRFGTAAEGITMDYAKSGFKPGGKEPSYRMSDPRLGQPVWGRDKVLQDPSYGVKNFFGFTLNPAETDRFPGYLTGVHMHYGWPRSGSKGCIIQKGWNSPEGLGHYLKNSDTGDQGRVHIIRWNQADE